MHAAIDEVFHAFRGFGVRCEKNPSRCTSCGSFEMMDTKNYVFYHEQDDEGIRGGQTGLYLAHNLEDEDIRKKVEAFCASSPNLYWDGTESLKIYLSCVGDAKQKQDPTYDAAAVARSAAVEAEIDAAVTKAVKKVYGTPPRPQVVPQPVPQEPRWFGQTDSLRFTIVGDKVFAGNKATGRAVPLSLKQLKQFGDNIRLYSNQGYWGNNGGLWGQGPLLDDYIKERKTCLKA